MSAKTFPLAAAFVCLISAPAFSADDPKELASKRQAVFKVHCYRCHGQDGAIEGGLNYIGDLGKLVSRKKVVPGDPAASRLFKRIDDGTMPPVGEKSRPERTRRSRPSRSGSRKAHRSLRRSRPARRSRTSDVYNFVSGRSRDDGPARAPLPALLLASRISTTPDSPTKNCRPTATHSTSSSTACRGARRS